MLLKYANENKLSLDQVKAQLAKSEMDNQTKRQLAAAEIELSRSERAQDRAHESVQNESDRQHDAGKHANQLNHDMAKHNTSLVRDELSTPDTP